MNRETMPKLTDGKLRKAREIFLAANATEHDAVSLIARGELDDFLIITRMDCDYYDVETGMDVW